ncbi:Armadillo/beta-catenin/plakoglobin [Mrakia frigida]|uniref:Armadillo/beta-catenin/plakoglobin n=1 Tax=Mrakia frigida TaxID=29902 RepID=UPI003FCC174C
MTVTLLTHPVVQGKVSDLRLVSSSSKQFRDGLSAISTFVGIEASKNLAVEDVPNLSSPLSPFTGKKVASRIGLAPILRAGLGMESALLELFPDAPVYHLGLFREKVSLQAVEYYSRLPSLVTVDTLYILDPLLATGGTAIAAVNMAKDWGLPVSQIKLLSVLGSSEGLAAIEKAFPELDIFIAAIDSQLTSKGYISPGVGDAGDRIYGTSS